jgi:hypothetical protein
MAESTNTKQLGLARLYRRSFWTGSVAFLVLLASAVASMAQEALQNQTYGEDAAVARTKALQHQDYTVKYGDFRMLVTPYAGIQWNDNVNLSETNKMDDFILTPGVTVVSSYPFTERNVLFLDISVGYSRYLNHPSLSTFDLNSSSGTGLSFDIGIKDVTINLHDWISYVQDAAQNGAVANTANYGTFQNTAGLAATWDLNKASLSAGYDHQTVLSTSAEFDNVNHSAELLFVRGGVMVHPQVTVGIESTAAYTRYDKDILNNNDAYTLGAYTDYTPDEFMKVSARGGYTTYQFQNSSPTVTTSDQNSWYADLVFSHQPTDVISYSLTAGHSVSLGTQSDLNENWHVRPNINWRIIKGWDFNTGFFYEHGKEGLGNVTGNNTETYDWYGGDLSVQHALTKNLTISLNYRLTLRNSDTPDNSYTQNLVGLQLTYHP